MEKALCIYPLVVLNCVSHAKLHSPYLFRICPFSFHCLLSGVYYFIYFYFVAFEKKVKSCFSKGYFSFL